MSKRTQEVRPEADSGNAVDEHAEPATFEGAIDRLGEIVRQLEQNELDLESALVSYEEGVGLAKTCLQKLQAAELRIREIQLAEADDTASDDTAADDD